jgi:general secretion pathway protein H
MGGKAAMARRLKSPIGSAEPCARSSGYMLLDLALALTIVLLLFAVAWPLAGPGTSHARRAATALDIATMLRRDRSLASSQRRPLGTRFDLSRRTVTSAAGRHIHLPRDVAMTVTTGAQCREDAQRFTIVFAPDGTSCGGVVELSRGAQTYSIKINWLSGMIDVVEGPKT